MTISHHQPSITSLSRPVIGVPTQNLQSIGGVPADIPASWVMSQRYIRALSAAGALSWMIPLVGDEPETLRGIYDELDGIFLPGGADIDPANYGEEAHARCDKSDPARDEVELSLVRWALLDGKPVLGVCRGLQLVNLAAGGTLYQDLAEQMPGSIKHDYFPFGGRFARDYLAHEVNVAGRTKLAEIFGAGALKVNSMHHQGVRRLGAQLVASAVAPDGLVEGIESGNGSYLVAVQWHPEALIEHSATSRRLFASFVDAANDYRDETERAALLR
jgi:putative glutamine amidotransferase